MGTKKGDRGARRIFCNLACCGSIGAGHFERGGRPGRCRGDECQKERVGAWREF